VGEKRRKYFWGKLKGKVKANYTDRKDG